MLMREHVGLNVCQTPAHFARNWHQLLPDGIAPRHYFAILRVACTSVRQAIGNCPVSFTEQVASDA